MAEIIHIDDLPLSMQSHELVVVMLDGANAKASRVAPCLTWEAEDADHPAPTAAQLSEARLVLLGAIRRWTEAGSGALQSQSVGPYGMTVDTRQRTGYHLWPSEITDLQAICSGGAAGRESFSIDTAPVASAHMAWCDLMFGGATCSCGASLTNYAYPIYELD